jgi:hypothetical protein
MYANTFQTFHHGWAALGMHLNSSHLMSGAQAPHSLASYARQWWYHAKAALGIVGHILRYHSKAASQHIKNVQIDSNLFYICTME